MGDMNFKTACILSEFPQQSDIIHLNHAAVSPWPMRTVMAVKTFAEENLKVGSLHYGEWLAKENQLRQQLCWLLNAESADDIALLKNTSEALSVVAYGLQWRQDDNIVSTIQEFPSNRIVWESLSRFGVELRQADLSCGPSQENAIFALADKRTRLLTVSSVQYGTGLRMNLASLGQFCREKGILFCVDAIQSLGAILFDVQKIHADFVMADGHKWMLGPEGLALFYCAPEIRNQLHLNQYGWHMVENHFDFEKKAWKIAHSARRFECGSPNMLGIHALSASLSMLQELGMEFIENKVLGNAAFLMKMIQENKELTLITPSVPPRYAGIVTFQHNHVNPLSLHNHLIRCGILCSLRNGAIRFSPHFYTPEDKLEKAINVAFTYDE